MIFIQENLRDEFDVLIKKTQESYIQRFKEIQECKCNNDINKIKDICKIPLGIELRKFIMKNISSLVNFKYSYCGVRFESIYIKKPGKLLNGSDSRILDNFKNALKYQMIANFEIFNNLIDTRTTSNDAILYGYKLLYNVNNSMTYNVNNTINYNPIDHSKIKIIVTDIISELLKDDYTVTDLSGVPHVLQKNYTYNNMELMTKEELANYINEAGIKPTIKVVVSYINTNNKLPNGKHLSNEALKYYIDKYGLRDMVSIKSRRTKAEMKLRKEILPSNICHDILNH